MSDATSPANVGRVLDRWARSGVPVAPSPFREALAALDVTCAHCKRRHHPPYGSGCYDGPFSVLDGPSSYTLTQQRRDEDAEREMTR